MTRLNNGLSGLVVALAAACGLLVTSGANAKSINVDFNTPGGAAGTYAAQGALTSDNGTKWNAITLGTIPFSSGTLVDSNNGATTATISFPDTHSYYDTTGDGPTRIAGFASPLLDDYAVNTGTFNDTANGGNAASTRFTIGGLINGGVYDLYLYSENGGYEAQTTTFTVGGITKTVNNSANAAANQLGFVAGGNYTTFLGVVATGGSITGSWAGDAGAFNGFQIVVPEPASMTLLASGGLLLLKRRVRRGA